MHLYTSFELNIHTHTTPVTTCSHTHCENKSIISISECQINIRMYGYWIFDPILDCLLLLLACLPSYTYRIRLQQKIFEREHKHVSFKCVKERGMWVFINNYFSSCCL